MSRAMVLGVNLSKNSMNEVRELLCLHLPLALCSSSRARTPGLAYLAVQARLPRTAHMSGPDQMSRAAPFGVVVGR